MSWTLSLWGGLGHCECWAVTAQLALLSCEMQHRRFHPPWSHPVAGTFPLELTQIQTLLSTTLLDERMRASMCMYAFIHMYSKVHNIQAQDGWMPSTKTQTMKTECDYLYGWIKMVTHARISTKKERCSEQRSRRRRSMHKGKQYPCSLCVSETLTILAPSMYQRP